LVKLVSLIVILNSGDKDEAFELIADHIKEMIEEIQLNAMGKILQDLQNDSSLDGLKVLTVSSN
jgi:hypothetical protein